MRAHWGWFFAIVIFGGPPFALLGLSFGYSVTSQPSAFGAIFCLALLIVPSWYFLIRLPVSRERARNWETDIRQRKALLAAQQRAAEEKRLAPQREAKQLEERRGSLLRAAQMNSDGGVVSFKLLAALLNSVQSQYAAAQYHFKERAVSPFWFCIEYAYAELARYHAALHQLQDAGAAHLRMLKDFQTAGGSAADFPIFPVDLDSARATSSAASASERLGALVYDAQKLDRFDTIWEQRRTTAALIAGFGRIETTIATMSGSLASGFSALTESVRSLDASQVRTQGAVIDAIAASNDAASLSGRPMLGAVSGAQAEVRAAAAELRSLSFS
jgi:hypothetical protein